MSAVATLEQELTTAKELARQALIESGMTDIQVGIVSRQIARVCGAVARLERARAAEQAAKLRASHEASRKFEKSLDELFNPLRRR